MSVNGAVKRRNRLPAGERGHTIGGVLSSRSGQLVIEAARQSGNLSDSLYFERLVRYLEKVNGELPVLTDDLERMREEKRITAA